MKNFRVVRSDNYGQSGEIAGRDESFVGDLYLSHAKARKLAELLNEISEFHGPFFYRAVERSYKLVKFEV